MLFACSQSPEDRAVFAGDRSPDFEKKAVGGSTSSPTTCEEIGGGRNTDVSPQHRRGSVSDHIDQSYQSVDDDGDQYAVVLGSAREHGQEEGLLLGDGKHRVDSPVDVVLRAAVNHVGRQKPRPDAAVVAPTAELSANTPITRNSDNEETRCRGGGGVGGVAKNVRVGGRREDGETSANSKDGELFFDPVLNCYYDRVSDKYYGLH